MGTKNNPGAWDCYANAEPDEPMFVLLGRDPMAGALVRLWAIMREEDREDPSKVQEARMCAEAMDTWARDVGKKPMSEPRVTGHVANAARSLVLQALVAGLDAIISRGASASLARQIAIDTLRSAGIEPKLPGCYCGRHTLLDSGGSFNDGRGIVHQLAGCRPAPIDNVRKTLAQVAAPPRDSIVCGGIVLPGWDCPACGCFNGSAKEQLTHCRSCSAPRPVPDLDAAVKALQATTKALSDNLTAVQERCTELLLENRELRGLVSGHARPCGCTGLNEGVDSIKPCQDHERWAGVRFRDAATRAQDLLRQLLPFLENEPAREIVREVRSVLGPTLLEKR